MPVRLRPPLLPLFAALMLTAFVVSNVRAQRPAAKPPAGSVAGRVVADNKPLAGVRVALMPGEMRWRERAVTQATTDDEGRYRLADVPPGRYNVVASAPLYVTPRESGFGDAGKPVTLDPGEELGGIDFSLQRGGVITGRVTDAEGQPVVEEPVTITPVDENNRRAERSFFFNPFDNATDDRGVYRIYGVPPGRYLVSAGQGGEDGMVRFGGGGFRARAFHPDARDEADAGVVEVSSGGEAKDIDIRLGRAARTFVATGRMIDAASGEPVAGVGYGYGAVRGENGMGGFGFANSRTNARGEFRVEGLLPGRYALVLEPGGSADRYAETKIFEVRDGDVSGIEIKVHQSSSISGVVVIEGAAPASVRARLAGLNLGAFPVQREAANISFGGDRGNVAADGTFRIGGLRPGKHRVVLANFPTPPPKGFTILRVEQNGAEPPEGLITVSESEAVGGVRVVLAYGVSTIRGRVTIQGGELPQNARLFVSARRPGDDKGMRIGAAQVDVNRRFLIEGLAAGTYELTLQGNLVDNINNAPLRFAPVKATVTVTGEGESQIEMTLDLTRRDEERTP